MIGTIHRAETLLKDILQIPRKVNAEKNTHMNLSFYIFYNIWSYYTMPLLQ